MNRPERNEPQGPRSARKKYAAESLGVGGMGPAPARSLSAFLAFLLALGPGFVPAALAQDKGDAAPAAQVETLRRLARAGYLGDKKDFYLSARSLSADDVTDALLKMDDSLSRVDPKDLNPGSSSYNIGDLKALLGMAKAKADDILARKVSAWRFENHLKKMIAALSTGGEIPTPESGTPTPAPPPQPTATPAPPPGPTRAEWNDLKSALQDLERKTGDLQGVYDRKLTDLQASNDSLRTSNADTQAQLKLVKNLLDRVQDDLKNTQGRLDDVAQKASQKIVDDTQLEQELEVMHKDLRDNTQDISVLKEQVAKLDETDNAGQSPLDQVLTSKYLAGGALLVGLAALVVSFARK